LPRPCPQQKRVHLSGQSIGWDERLSVATGGKNLVGHAGAVLLRQCADRTGLTRALSRVLPRGKGPGWWDRGAVLVSLAVSIVLGATSMSDINLLAHQVGVFGQPPSESTVRRTLDSLDETVLADEFDQIPAKYRSKILVRVDGAGATHELLRHLDQMNTLWRTVRFTVGWTITATDEAAIAVLRETESTAAGRC
jgi:hypothetical protein